jgi:malonyl-CoA/methylmalonyl-CoA synthetase
VISDGMKEEGTETTPEGAVATGELELVRRARAHGDRTAIRATEGSFTYDDLLSASEAVARTLLGERDDLGEDRVAFLVPPDFQYAAVQWGIWRAGGIAVPMAVSHPPRELKYVLEDADPVAVVAHPSMMERLGEARGLPVLSSTAVVGGGAGGRFGPDTGSGPDAGALRALPAVAPSRRAMMLYTSGTTGRPKGVVTTHANIEAQVRSLVEAWAWNADDHILLTLPLHHVHGIVNVLTCALWSGARCTILPTFQEAAVWNEIARDDLTLYMAVPTIYAKLLAAWEAAPEERREAWSEGCRRLRLMVSGSAALPVSMLERWREVSGHTLLERYGMTEIGMGLSNPLEGERRPGYVGRPLPGVEIRLVGEDGRPADEGEPGEIQVRGPTVFREYWRRPEETAAAFHDGWFCTGDMAVVEDGAYRILGRSSVDIIKTGGFKVSALEVEEVLRTHPAVADCAVVAVPDEEWGERVAAALVPATGTPGPPDDAELRVWMKERLAPYKAPSLYLTLPELPRNAMGKVTKPAVQELFRERGAGVERA